MQDREILVVGLGSMGKRRIRCLRTLGFKKVFAFDINKDRNKPVIEGIEVDIVTRQEIANGGFDACFVCTPPDNHHEYLKDFASRNIPTFIEASVISEGLPEVQKIAAEKRTLIAPSITLLFHPAVKLIRRVISEKRLGHISSFTYLSGQYLPHWHPYEKVSDFYVSNPITGGAREIVPFELGWMSKVFGPPTGCFAFVKKTIDIEGAEKIDDTYCISLNYGSFSGTMNVNVVSEYAQRYMNIVLSGGNLIWNWEDDFITILERGSEKWEEIKFDKGPSAKGYNENISEGMYIDEVSAFLSAAFESRKFPNTLNEDMSILGLLQSIEHSSHTEEYMKL